MVDKSKDQARAGRTPGVARVVLVVGTVLVVLGFIIVYAVISPG